MPVTMDAAVAGVAPATPAAARVAGVADPPDVAVALLAAASLNPDMPGIVCCIFGTLAWVVLWCRAVGNVVGVGDQY